MKEIDNYTEVFKLNQIIWWVGHVNDHCPRLSQGKILSVTPKTITVILKPLLADNTESTDHASWNRKEISNRNIDKIFTSLQDAIDHAKVEYELRLNNIKKLMEEENDAISCLYSIQRTTNPPIDTDLLIGDLNERRFYQVSLEKRPKEYEQIAFYMSKGQAYQSQIKQQYPDFTDFHGYDDFNTFLKDLIKRFQYLIDLYYDDYSSEEALSKNKDLVNFYESNFVPLYNDEQTKRMSLLELIEQLS